MNTTATIEALSDATLSASIPVLCSRERKATHALLIHLIEFDNRRLYAGQGFSSLFDFLTRRLGYSEGSAQRRILGARCMREHPELGELFLEGKVTLCSIAIATSSIKREKTEVKEIVGKSKREVEALVAAKEPERKVKREVVRAFSPVCDPAPSSRVMSLFSASSEPTATTRLSPPKSSEENKDAGSADVHVRSSSADVDVRAPGLRYEIKFSLSKAEYLALEEARNRLSNSLGSTLTVAAVLNKLVDRFLKPYRKSEELKSSGSRYIPASVRHEVYRRDRGECSYVAPDGTKCTEKQHLQFDHVHPYALGGKTEASNLRLACPMHNRLYAERYFGRYEVKEPLIMYGA